MPLQRHLGSPSLPVSLRRQLGSPCLPVPFQRQLGSPSLPVPLGRQLGSPSLPVPLRRQLGSPSLPVPLRRQLWSRSRPVPLRRQLRSSSPALNKPNQTLGTGFQSEGVGQRRCGGAGKGWMNGSCWTERCYRAVFRPDKNLLHGIVNCGVGPSRVIVTAISNCCAPHAICVPQFPVRIGFIVQGNFNFLSSFSIQLRRYIRGETPSCTGR